MGPEASAGSLAKQGHFDSIQGEESFPSSGFRKNGLVML